LSPYQQQQLSTNLGVKVEATENKITAGTFHHPLWRITKAWGASLSLEATANIKLD